MLEFHCLIPFIPADVPSSGDDGSSLIRQRRSLFDKRRTLPFQLVPQPPLSYARSDNFVGEPQPLAISTNLEDEADEYLDPFGKYKRSDMKMVVIAIYCI